MKPPPNHPLYLPYLTKFNFRSCWLDCYQSKSNMADIVLGENMRLPASQISTFKIVYTSYLTSWIKCLRFSWYVYRFDASHFKVRKNGRCNSKNLNYFTRSLDVQFVSACHNLEFIPSNTYSSHFILVVWMERQLKMRISAKYHYYHSSSVCILHICSLLRYVLFPRIWLLHLIILFVSLFTHYCFWFLCTILWNLW